MNPTAKPDMECGCCPGNRDTDCCDCCFVRQNHIFFSICLPILCVVWIVLFVVFAAVYFPVGMILIFYIAGPVTIVTSITACCCLCFCRMKQRRAGPKPTVRNVQYVQQQRPVAQPTVQYVQPMPRQYAPQRSPARVARRRRAAPAVPAAAPAAPPIVRMPQPAPAAAPVRGRRGDGGGGRSGGRQRHRDGAGVGKARAGGTPAGLVAALRAAPPGHKAPAVISHCMRHMEQPQPLPGDLASSTRRWQPRRDAVEVADLGQERRPDGRGGGCCRQFGAVVGARRRREQVRLDSQRSGEGRLAASVPGLSPRAPSRGAAGGCWCH